MRKSGKSFLICWKLSLLRTLLFIILCTLGLKAQQNGFVPNAGQWEGEFDFRLRDAQGLVFLKAEEHRVVLLPPQHFHSDEHHHHEHQQKAHVYNIKWIGSNADAEFSSRLLKHQPKLNFLLGNNPEQWAAGLEQYREVVYHDLYPQIDLRYYLSSAGVLAYDFIVHPGGKVDDIQWQIEGVAEQGLLSEDLVLLTSVGSAVYSAPLSFQEEEVPSSFRQIEPGIYGFEVPKYNRRKKLIIDPTLIFSTYSGSTDDNFGFSATFGEDGSAYGAGIVYGYSIFHRAYPTTLGSFQDSSQGGRVDIAISKYTADGTDQIYATYMGGSNNELPYSLLEGPNKSLIILGATGSRNFPMHPSGYDTAFSEGTSDVFNIGGSLPLPYSSDIFISILDSTGGALLGATFFGDSLSDGANKRLSFNYGDDARGDITLDANGNIIVSSYTFSPNLATGSAQNSNYLGGQDGLILSFDGDLQNLNWARYLGGSGHDATTSVRFAPSGRLYVTGTTESDSLSYDTTGVYQPYSEGMTDAFLAELDPQNGNVLKWTFSGTTQEDRCYFVDFTPQGNLVLFGQTAGAWPWVGDSIWGIPNSAMFLQELSPDLDRVVHSTTFGDGNLNETDISPTALMVSDCGDIFLSGWGANYGSRRGNMGNPDGLPVTPDAYRDSSDGAGEFYFMRMASTWQKLEYATYFGDVGGNDHVDGGSSRFRKDGSIFQAVCACADNFPISTDAFADTNGSFNCNLAVFRFDMQADTVICRIGLSPGFTDSTCTPGAVKFQNLSFNSDVTLVIDPNGVTDTLRNQIFPIQNSGVSKFEFIAMDTNCLLIDTTSYIVYGFNQPISADFSFDYDSCDGSGTVQFNNLSSGATQYRWFFGDSSQATTANPNHSYLLPGTYTVQLVAGENVCNTSDTLETQITISFRTNQLGMASEFDACDPERNVLASVDLSRIDTGDFQIFDWYINDQLVQSSDSLKLQLAEPGSYTLKLLARDTVCNRVQEFEDSLFFYEAQADPGFPNVFTPNGDGVNDLFGLLNPEQIAPFLSKASLEIYNRNGTQLYIGDLQNLEWNGQNAAVDLPEGVYFYIFNYEDICGGFNEAKGFVHLQR